LSYGYPPLSHLTSFPTRRSSDLTGGMQNSLRFSGRAAGIENVKRMLGIEGNGLAIRTDVFQLAMPPNIAPFLHVNFIAHAFENDHTFDRGAAAQSVVDIIF